MLYDISKYKDSLRFQRFNNPCILRRKTNGQEEKQQGRPHQGGEVHPDEVRSGRPDRRTERNPAQDGGRRSRQPRSRDARLGPPERRRHVHPARHPESHAAQSPGPQGRHARAQPGDRRNDEGRRPSGDRPRQSPRAVETEKSRCLIRRALLIERPCRKLQGRFDAQ